MGVGGRRHAPAALPPGKRHGTHCIGGWVGPRAGLDGCGKSRPHRESIPDIPARSESPYRLHYPDPVVNNPEENIQHIYGLFNVHVKVTIRNVIYGHDSLAACPNPHAESTLPCQLYASGYWMHSQLLEICRPYNEDVTPLWQNEDTWWTLVSTTMDLRFSSNAESFLTGWRNHQQLRLQ
jgi:hypothetical protein